MEEEEDNNGRNRRGRSKIVRGMEDSRRSWIMKDRIDLGIEEAKAAEKEE